MYMHRDSLLKTPPPVPPPELHRSPCFNSEDQWHASTTFKAACDLWLIVNDFLPLYYNSDGPEDVDTRSLAGTVTRIYERLLTWRESLLPELKNSQHPLPHILNLR